MDYNTKLKILDEFVENNPGGVELVAWTGRRMESDNQGIYWKVGQQQRLEVFEANWQYILDWLVNHHNEATSWHGRKVGECLDFKREMKAAKGEAVTG